MSRQTDPSDPLQRRRAAARGPSAGPPRNAGARSAHGPGLSVAVVDGLGRPRRAPGLAAWLRETMPPTLRGEVAIALVGDARMRRLNRTYRGADYATDVLSFPPDADVGTHAAARDTRHARSPEQAARSTGHAAPGTKHAARRTCLGDIVIATGVAARQARERGHSPATEIRILALHGLLHLLGHDHERDDGQMAAIERRLRRKGGLAAGLIEREARR